MGRTCYYIIFFLLFSRASFSQSVFHGKVIIEKTNESLGAASVYFNNTSIGTTTNDSGAFRITVPGLSNPQLVISSIGFETIAYHMQPGAD